MIDVLVVGGVFREILDGDTSPRLRYGGSGLTSAVAAARMGARVALASYVGDEDEDAVRAELLAAGVGDASVVTVAGASGTFVFPTQQDPSRPWPMYRPAEAVPLSAPRDLPPAPVVVAFGIPDCDPIADGWLAGLDEDVTLIWDRQGWLSRARDSLKVAALRPSRKIYLANEEEAIEESGATAPDDALALQPPSGFDAAVIKRGPEGVFVAEHTARGIRGEAVPAFPVATSSTVGSGDVFAGAFAARLAHGDSTTEAARWGCAAAAVSLRSQTNLLGDGATAAAESLLLAR